MKYDFSTQVNRSEMGSSKWNSMYKKDPNVPKDIVPFSVADMEFKMAPEIVEGLKEQIDSEIFGYTKPTDRYYDAIISWQKRIHNFDIEKEWIVTTPGVVTAVKYLVKTFTKPNDKVLLLTPSYYPFFSCISVNDCERVECDLIYKDGKYSIDFEDLEKKASDPKTTCMILCSPHNPVGRVWTKEELCKVADICLKHDVKLISDEIHNDLIMSGQKHYVLPSLKPEYKDIPVCTSCSKTFNLAGLQVSNIIVANDEVRKEFLKHLAHAGFGSLNIFSYRACELAYNKAEGWYRECLKTIEDNSVCLKNFVEKNMPKVKVIPLEGTYLQWLDFNALNKDYKLLEEKMEKHYLYLDEGYIFGKCGEGFERINLACPKDTLMKALDRMLEVYKELENE